MILRSFNKLNYRAIVHRIHSHANQTGFPRTRCAVYYPVRHTSTWVMDLVSLLELSFIVLSGSDRLTRSLLRYRYGNARGVDPGLLPMFPHRSDFLKSVNLLLNDDIYRCLFSQPLFNLFNHDGTVF